MLHVIKTTDFFTPEVKKDMFASPFLIIGAKPWLSCQVIVLPGVVGPVTPARAPICRVSEIGFTWSFSTNYRPLSAFFLKDPFGIVSGEWKDQCIVGLSDTKHEIVDRICVQSIFSRSVIDREGIDAILDVR